MDTNYLTTQVSTIVGQLHGLFDEIGVPGHERESRESEAGQELGYGNTPADANYSCSRHYPKLYIVNCASSLREILLLPRL